ncbi:MAG TPA: phenylalanine 4-monooxygenase [Bacteriovoracaceae bacterium]|nr:phenylalanine 4-monooxygenase [Bacteriovoracaceae bacterium]
MKTTYVSKQPGPDGQIDWTADENHTWKTLITRQSEIVKTRASSEFLEGLDRIGFSVNEVPQHSVINHRLKDFTGWQVEIVPALIPAKEFFNLLASKKFPAASFIRVPKDLDYIQEPDIFHEFYGHVPLLTFPDYAMFMEEFGKLALSIAPKDRSRLFRLFWFTIEFGLVHTPQGTKAYGGGMLSSIHETVYSVESQVPKRVDFDPLTVLRTPYRIDIPQPLYYVLNNFQDLYKILDQDLRGLLEESKGLGDFEPLFELAGKEL